LTMNRLDIRKIRKAMGLTQTELAERLGVHYKTIQNWEKGGVIPESKMVLLRTLKIIKTEITSDGAEAGNPELAGEKELGYLNPPYATYLLPFSARPNEINRFYFEKAGHERVASPVKGADFATILSDDGLGPEFPDGALVFFRHIDPSLFIEWGKVHAVSTRNGLIIKRLSPGREPGRLLCSCADPQFEPFEITVDDPDMDFYKAVACTAIK